MLSPSLSAYTLKNACSFEGLGIHSGQHVTLHCRPSYDQDKGIFIRRSDQEGATLRLCSEHYVQSHRASCFDNGKTRFQTPEHLLSACHALGLTHLCLEIDGEECPILDGSALQFLKGLKAAGRERLPFEQKILTLTQPLSLADADARLLGLPYDGFRITFVLDYPNHFVGQQIYDFSFNLSRYENEIAAARTYGFEKEVKALLQQNLALGGSLENALVIGEKDYLNPLRFPDELVRHKILDLIGDLWVTQRPLSMHLIAFKSGHDLNRRFLQVLCDHNDD